MPKFNNVELTQETTQQTRQWFADNAMLCIADVKNGITKVNDKQDYFLWCYERAAQALHGDIDHTFTFLQRAYFFQTGECIALLP